jgi:hypothetical protein
MDAAIIQSGRFTSTGVAKTLQIRSDFDWIQVYNYTKTTGNGTAVTGSGFSFYWQVGMPVGGGIFTGKAAGAATLVEDQIAANAGFTPVDSSGYPLGAAFATTNISAANPPLILAATTPLVGDIVRLYNNTLAREVNGYDFSVQTVNPGVSFTIGGAFNAAVDGNGAQPGLYRVVRFDPLYYPRSRYIMNITQAAQAVVTLTVPSGYVVGQSIRFSVPPQFGMIQLDQQVATIVAVNDALATQTITVNIDTTAYTAFTFPLNASYPFSPAMVVPMGENTAYAIAQAQNILSDATYNTGYIGVILASGANSPAGANADVIYWVAGKSSYTQNP